MPADGLEARASYAPGGAVAITSPVGWLLASTAADDTVLEQAWRALRAGGVSEAKRLVQEAADEERSNFGLVAWVDDRVLVTLTRAVTVEVTTALGAETLHCPAPASAVEFTLAELPTSVVLRQGSPAETPRLPIESGMVAAGLLAVEWRPAFAGDGPGFPRHLRGPVSPEPHGLLGPGRSQRSDVTLSAVPEAVAEARDQDPDPPAKSPAEVQVPPRAARLGATTDEPRTDGTYDHLFGHTVSRVVEDAAVRAAEPDQEGVTPTNEVVASPPSSQPQPQDPPPAVLTPVRPAAPPTPVRPAAPAAPLGPSLIDAVPGAAVGRASSQRTPPNAKGERGHGEGDEAQLTVNRAAHQELLRRLAAPGALAPPGPMVHAVHCPAGHANPAHADRCRVCSAPVAEQPPVTVPRPVLGQLRLSTGDEVILDRGVLMGRAPSEARRVGEDRPHLVRLPSPEHDISRNHLEVRLDGWHVLVTDLGSTNGTVVTRPGQHPERLRPDEPTIIEPGTTVSLADEVTFDYEASG